MKRRLLYAGLLLLACGAVIAMPSSGPHRRGEAAIAIRDTVPGYQQFFTEHYTVPRLEAAYEQYWYFTETPAARKRTELINALREATTKYEHVDLYLLAHGNRYIDAAYELSPEQRRRIRLVYDTGGGSAHQGDEWMRLGVGTFIGHPGGNIAPAFYVYFLPEWLHSQDAQKAMQQGNEGTKDLIKGPIGAVASNWVDTQSLWEGTEAQLFRR
jgi:hypothetical protein